MFLISTQAFHTQSYHYSMQKKWFLSNKSVCGLQDFWLDEATTRIKASDAYFYVDNIVNRDMRQALRRAILQYASSIFRVCSSGTKAHSAGLAVSIILLLSFCWRTSRELTTNADSETSHVAEMLSLMPEHLNIVALVEGYLKSNRQLLTSRKVRTATC